MHGRHDLDRFRLGGERRREHPGIQVRTKKSLGNERDFEAEFFRPLEDVDRIEIVLVDAATVSRQSVEGRLDQRDQAEWTAGPDTKCRVSFASPSPARLRAMISQ